MLAAHEIIHSVKQSRQKRIFLKVYFKKAYDKVNWSFINELLLSRGDLNSSG
jgi:hypothetical protein